jgi:LacI family transcriptional regulator
VRRTGEGAVTIKDVARESGFSSSTVSIVLNNAPLARYIPAATKAKIMTAAKRLGYRPNPFSRSLRSNRSHTIGVMVFDMADPYCMMVLRGIENALHQSAYLPLLADVQNDRALFERDLEMLLDRRVEGLIVLANWMFMDIALLADLEKSSIPTVIIGGDVAAESISSVMVDNEAGGAMAMEHLHSLGHRHIAVIRGPKPVPDSAPRWRGMKKFAETHHLTLNPKLVIELPEARDTATAFQAAYQLTSDLLHSRRSFTAMATFDDMSAYGAMRALHKARRRVPEDCSIIGFDDISFSHLSTPALTTIRQPMDRMGSSAVNLLMERIQAEPLGKAAPVRRSLTPELVVRETTLRLR